MNILEKTKIILLGLMVLLAACSPQKKAEQTIERPNVIFFIADDMYPEMFNCLPEGKGKNLTPNIDRLAEEGVLMINQTVVSPVCTPSRYNCLTGNYASRAVNKSFLRHTANNDDQTVIQWNSFISEGSKALPHYLQDAGYKTGMVGKCHVVEVDSIYKFPDFWADARDPEIDARVKENYNRTVSAIKRNGFDYAGSIYHDNPNFVGLGELAVQNMDWIAQAGLDFIDKYHDDPFFLYFATTIPHQPSNPERSWQADPLITANGYLDEAPDVLPARETLPERIKEAGLEGKNKELILWLDDAVGALFNKLEEHGQLDNTIIFFFNDHGQKAKGTLYQGGVASPSIVWKSGGFVSENVNTTKVQNIDFAPTILEMIGEENVNEKFDGKSFLPQLNGAEEDAERALFYELGYARGVVKGDFKYYAIRYPEFAENMSEKERTKRLEDYNETRRFRNMKIVNYDPAAPFSHFSIIPGGQQAEHESYGKLPGYFDRDQLYNLKNDPKELVNLAKSKEHQAILSELKAELKAHLEKMPGNFNL